ncbi:ferrochelatase [Kiloniella majae]|uniref:ferrochelatase n=1 Tax=Kiloniella majae TaxID=1938558 RepID=UPI000A277FBE|nr:ferrochelatase [Kiloniella majae]
MTMQVIPENHPQIPAEKVGVLLMNLGTPDGTDYWSMRRYLSEFLSDPRVIEAPKWLWQIILQGIILTTRPSKSGEAYKEIWNKEKDESPLRTITRDQAEKLQTALAEEYPNVIVDWGWRYGNPAVKERIEDLQKQGCNRILLFALYPQYSATTTATAYDKCFDTLKTMRWQPSVRCVPAYHDAPVYIDALATSVKEGIEKLSWKPDVTIASFHGLPVEYHEKGDPYYCHCAKTARLLREKLGWSEDKLKLCFQSLFGPKEWLKPYTQPTVEEMARNGVKNLVILTPGFSVDCVETLEEIDIGVREAFLDNGGENFAFIPCLNDSVGGMNVIKEITVRELQGWI